MEAKDTVMRDGDWEAINQKAGVDVIGIVINLDGRYTPIQQAELIVERCNLTAQAQAEISFKAGIREVVEWIDKNELYWRSVSTTKHDYYILLGLADTWQAKLKEWNEN